MTPRKPLGSKKENTLAPICRKLQSQGYVPGFFADGKDRPGKGWPTRALKLTDGGSTLCIRMRDNQDLAGDDIDITHPELNAKALELLYARFPSLCQAPHRHSGGLKVMLFMRCHTEGKQLKSRAWVHPDAPDEPQRIEFFTSNDVRYVCTHGKHSEGREYGWKDGLKLEDVAFTDLPEVTYDDIATWLMEFDAAAEAMGFEKKAESLKGKGDPIYDLLPEMEIKLEDGSVMTLADLEALAPGQGKWRRAYATPWDPASTTKTRVKYNIGPLGLELWDTKDEVMHYWAEHKPPDLDLLAGLIRTHLMGNGAGAPPASGSIFSKDWWEEFVAFQPEDNAISLRTGMAWKQTAINRAFPAVKLTRPDGTVVMTGTGNRQRPVMIKPYDWLVRMNPVEQLVYMPGAEQIIRGRVMRGIDGWRDAPGSQVLNIYNAPMIMPGEARMARLWLELVERLCPGDIEHMLKFIAHRIQRGGEKINHMMMLTGKQGIGKDTLLAPLQYGVGPGNYKLVSPQSIMKEAFNDYMQSVVLLIPELHDLGDTHRSMFYEKLKPMIAAPPDAVRINNKNVKQYYIPNITGVVGTSNHGLDAMWLPPDDRRVYVAHSLTERSEEHDEFVVKVLHAQKRSGLLAHAVAYLQQYDLSAFDAGAAPPRTKAWQMMALQSSSPESALLADALDALNRPVAVTLAEVYTKAHFELAQYFKRSPRAVSHRMEECGYGSEPNPHQQDGRWKINRQNVVVYVRNDVRGEQRLVEARKKATGTAEGTATIIPMKKPLGSKRTTDHGPGKGGASGD